MKSVFEENGGTFIAEGDYFLPNLTIAKQKAIGIYGQRHRRFLKDNQPMVYTTMLLTGKLVTYLLSIDEQANKMKERIVCEMAAMDGLSEELKEENLMEWVGRMNQIYNAAEEMINRELIYHLVVNEDA